jgi:hypothetical protein
MSVECGKLIIDQMEFYWDVYFRPKLDGLTDDEYLWEPVSGCWSLRLDANGLYQVEMTDPEPEPAPVTTIAWRLMHFASNMYFRSSTFFGDGSVPESATMFDPRHQPPSVPGTAQEGLAFLDRAYQRWRGPLSKLSEEEMATPLGPRGDYFANDSMSALVLHVNREMMHHGGEVLLLRDLYRTTGGARLD